MTARRLKSFPAGSGSGLVPDRSRRCLPPSPAPARGRIRHGVSMLRSMPVGIVLDGRKPSCLRATPRERGATSRPGSPPWFRESPDGPSQLVNTPGRRRRRMRSSASACEKAVAAAVAPRSRNRPRSRARSSASSRVGRRLGLAAAIADRADDAHGSPRAWAGAIRCAVVVLPLVPVTPTMTSCAKDGAFPRRRARASYPAPGSAAGRVPASRSRRPRSPLLVARLARWAWPSLSVHEWPQKRLPIPPRESYHAFPDTAR